MHRTKKELEEMEKVASKKGVKVGSLRYYRSNEGGITRRYNELVSMIASHEGIKPVHYSSSSGGVTRATSDYLEMIASKNGVKSNHYSSNSGGQFRRNKGTTFWNSF